MEDDSSRVVEITIQKFPGFLEASIIIPLPRIIASVLPIDCERVRYIYLYYLRPLPLKQPTRGNILGITKGITKWAKFFELYNMGTWTRASRDALFHEFSVGFRVSQ